MSVFLEMFIGYVSPIFLYGSILVFLIAGGLYMVNSLLKKEKGVFIKIMVYAIVVFSVTFVLWILLQFIPHKYPAA